VKGRHGKASATKKPRRKKNSDYPTKGWSGEAYNTTSTLTKTHIEKRGNRKKWGISWKREQPKKEQSQ